MKNIKIILSGLAALTSVIIYSCQKEAESGKTDTRVYVYLTDHQTPVFDSVFIDLQKLEVKLEDDTLPNGGWYSLAIRTGVYNILRFRNGLDTLFGTGTLPNNRIRKIRLTLGEQNSVMKDNQSFPLRVKDNEREIVINIYQTNYDVVAPDQVLFWIDFDAGRSIRVDNSGSGSNNGFELKASVKIFTHRTTGRIEGRILPVSADAVVMAIRGTDTTVAIPDDDDGEFKIVGLVADNYVLFVDGNNAYRDTTITNVVVRTGEDTRLPLITLRQ